MDCPAARDPGFDARVRASFARQGFMALIGAELARVEPGEVEIRLALRPQLCQQNGHGHAGVAWSIADTAAGFAAMSLMAPDADVLTVEMKINLLAPARGEALRAGGRVGRAGRRVTVVRSDVYAIDGGAETRIATAMGTMMTMPGPGDAG